MRKSPFTEAWGEYGLTPLHLAAASGSPETVAAQ